jgi:AcrR family transcriptional regulator
MNKRSAADSRRNILDAAHKVFSDYGYTGTSMRMVADNAGMSVGGVYIYFRNKEALYLTLMEEIFGELDDRVHREVATLDDPVDALGALIKTRIDSARRNTALILSKTRKQDFPAGFDLIRAFSKRQLKIIEEIIGDGVERGLFNSCDIREMARIVNVTLRGFILSMAIDPDNLFSPEAYSRLLLMGLLKRPEGGTECAES